MRVEACRRAALLLALCAALTSTARAQDRDAERAELGAQSVELERRLSEIRVVDGPGGPGGANEPGVRVATDHGDVDLTPTEFVRAIQGAQEAQKRRGFLYVLFNITHPWGFLWVSVGFLAQALFTYRMILQWWASEKHKRSVVPVGYWWGSMFGGALLFAYFVWRKDIVGYIGQTTGIFIYARNLVLIYRGRRIEAEGARPLAADEPAPNTAS
jgi:lipid-A-disaccharide synthase-like uncharacterized protein